MAKRPTAYILRYQTSKTRHTTSKRRHRRRSTDQVFWCALRARHPSLLCQILNTLLVARCRYSCCVSLFMLVKKVSSEKTCFQTGASQMLFTDVDCVRHDLVGVHRPKHPPSSSRTRLMLLRLVLAFIRFGKLCPCTLSTATLEGLNIT